MSHRYDIFSWWWAHSRPKHVQKSNKHIKKFFVPSWFYLQDNRTVGKPGISLTHDIGTKETQNVLNNLSPPLSFSWTKTAFCYTTFDNAAQSRARNWPSLFVSRFFFIYRMYVGFSLMLYVFCVYHIYYFRLLPLLLLSIKHMNRSSVRPNLCFHFFMRYELVLRYLITVH